MEEKIFDIIMKGDEVTWLSLIQDLVRVENMNPWDIDISKLSQRYIMMLKKMQELDLRVSGKVVLAAAILLRMKSAYLIDRDLLNFDRLMHPDEYAEDALYEEPKRPDINIDEIKLLPRTPQPRKRKVSIYDLVEALKQALEVKNRRRQILESIDIKFPDKKIDITKIIEDLYKRIEDIFRKENYLTFSQLVQSKKREEIVGAFVPILHLSNEHRIELAQEEHFGEIGINLPVNKENSRRKEKELKKH